jgi:hypothetical protein
MQQVIGSPKSLFLQYLVNNRRTSSVATLALLLCLFGVLSNAGSQAAAAEASTRPSIDAATKREFQKDWRKSMARKLGVDKAAPIGCFHAAYPSNEWQAVTCLKAPKLPYVPVHGTRIRSNAVGDGTDFSAQTSTLLSSAEGSFISFSGVTSIGAATGPFSLQLNSNFFTTPACSGIAGCQGWQQFVFVAPGTSNPAASGLGFIQYWLVNYGGTCPQGYISYAGTDCYLTQVGGTAISIPNPTLAQVSQLGVIGAATSGGTDTLIVSTGNDLYALTEADSILTLSQGWNTAEFNILGNANGNQVNFNSNATIVVKTSVDGGTTTAPSCINQGYTGETNNLTLDLCCPIGGASPAIIFMESNVTGATSSCAILTNESGTTLSLSGTGTIVNSHEAIYQLTIHNSGSAAAANVVVSAQVPYGSTVLASDGNGNSSNCTAVNSSSSGALYTLISCVISAVSAQASQTWYVEVQLPSGDLVSNTALNFSIASQSGNLTPAGGSVSITAVAAPPPTDGPLPLWAYSFLAVIMCFIARRQLKVT